MGRNLLAGKRSASEILLLKRRHALLQVLQIFNNITEGDRAFELILIARHAV
jgi:hypothetical protein